MYFSSSVFVAASGLFDFDLTFLAEGGLFLLLSLAISFLFLGPISTEMNLRVEFINSNLKKAALFLFFGDQNVSNLISLAFQESNEILRQKKIIQQSVNLKFEKEIIRIQDENLNFLAKFERSLIVKSALLFSNFKNSLSYLTDTFFMKKFK